MGISANIRRIKEAIPQGVEYVVVSKYRPQEELQEAYDAGMRVFAESRPAELARKAALLPGDIQWHFIGHLQTNKLKLVLPYCALIQSVDSVRLMEAMEKYCAASRLTANILLEVHVAAEQSKQGFTPAETVSFFKNAAYKDFPHLRFCGLMGMATHCDRPERIEADFALMEDLFNGIKDSGSAPSEFRELSIGMSGDYHIAVRHGATMVRIGSATFESNT